MATSTCVKCNGTRFESVLQATIPGLVYFIQCGSCGGVVGVVPVVAESTKVIARNKVLKAVAENVLGRSVNFPTD